MKEIGRNIQYNGHNTTLLIRTLKYLKDLIAEGTNFFIGRVQTHKHTPYQEILW